MNLRELPRRFRERDWDLVHVFRLGLTVLGKALTRMWGRDVMLYTGGTSFFVMLAIFPALAILIGLYSLLSDPARVAEQGEYLANVMPDAARLIFQGELVRLSQAPHETISVQSGVALVIGGYASHRGFKAFLAGLSFIHDEHRPRGFFSFNFMALVVLFAVFGLLGMLSAVFFAFGSPARPSTCDPCAASCGSTANGPGPAPAWPSA
jgi:membrane protein